MHQVSIPQHILDRVRAVRGRDHIFDSIDMSKTAHVIVDMQVGFVAEGAPIEVPMTRQISDTINAISRTVRDNGGGTIVNVASIAGRRGSSQVDYGASKAAVINLTTTLARVMAPFNIRINAVAPALVDAGMGPNIDPRARQAFLEQTPLKRAATAHEVADVITFLAGDRSTYVTGETIDIHGGL